MAEYTPNLSLSGTSMLLCGMLLTAVFGGYVARALHTPRVVGYLLGGCVLKFVLEFALDRLGAEYTPEALDVAAAPLTLIKDIALGLILFTIGGVFERSRLMSVIEHVWRISLLEVLLVPIIVALGCMAVGLFTGIGESGRDAVLLALLLGAAATATAPAATLSVIQEYESKGPITDTILGLTGIDNIACIVFFHCLFLSLAYFGWLDTKGVVTGSLLMPLIAITLGSVVIGTALGFLMSIAHERLAPTESVIVLVGTVSLLHASEQWLILSHGYAPNLLLVALVMGAVFSNIAIDSRQLEEGVRFLGAPLIILFFVLAGFELHIEDLAHMGLLGAAYVALRFAGKELACNWGTRWAGAPERTNGRLGDGLLCQAAVVVGLAAHVRRMWDSPLAETFSTVVLGGVVVFELVGPVLLKRRVVDSGEVKMITLLSRSVPPRERPARWRGALERVTRALPLKPVASTSGPGELQVRHIMRSNVQLIRASATLDEVLHFIERSTHSHFPVVHADATLAGIIHFSDVRDVIYDPYMRDLVTAVDLADPDSATVTPELSLQQVMTIFADANVAVLPVVESRAYRRFLGLIEQRDLLRAMHIRERSNR